MNTHTIIILGLVGGLFSGLSKTSRNRVLKIVLGAVWFWALFKVLFTNWRSLPLFFLSSLPTFFLVLIIRYTSGNLA